MCLRVIILKFLTMKKIKFIFLSFILVLVSCNSNDENNSNDAQQSLATRIFLNAVIGSGSTVNANSSSNTTLGFIPVFPLDVNYSNGSRIGINSMEGLKEAIYNENSSLHISNIVFPFSVQFTSTNEELVINDESQFQSLLFSIDSITTIDEFFTANNCFEFIFPLAVKDNDGNTVTISNLQALQNLLSSMSENDYWTDFVYPFQVQYGGSVTTVQDIWDFYNVVDCNPDGWYCTFDFNPTCVQTQNGVVQFDNPCWAIQAGYSEADFISCE